MLCDYAECHYAERRVLFTIILNVVMLSVFMINVIMLNVVAPRIACRIPTVILKVSGHVYPVASVGLIRVKVSKSSLSAQMSEKVKIKSHNGKLQS
jgi:hypothetical protein